ncbi:MAG: hypothetical protein LBH49_03755 [Puniceicoccales bacterium]|nr:hypothetical protein [Puniceicoccales bacterium]
MFQKLNSGLWLSLNKVAYGDIRSTNETIWESITGNLKSHMGKYLPKATIDQVSTKLDNNKIFIKRKDNVNELSAIAAGLSDYIDFSDGEIEEKIFRDTDNITAKNIVNKYTEVIRDLANGLVDSLDNVNKDSYNSSIISNIVDAINSLKDGSIQSLGNDTDYVNAATKLRDTLVGITSELEAMAAALGGLNASNAVERNDMVVSTLKKIYDVLQTSIGTIGTTSQDLAVANLFKNLCDFIRRVQGEISLAILPKHYALWATDDTTRAALINKLELEKIDHIIDHALIDGFIEKLTNYTKPKLIDLFPSEINNYGISFLQGTTGLSNWLALIPSADIKNRSLSDVESNISRLNSLVWDVIISEESSTSAKIEEITKLPTLTLVNGEGLSPEGIIQVNKINAAVRAYNDAIDKFRNGDLANKIIAFCAARGSDESYNDLMTEIKQILAETIDGHAGSMDGVAEIFRRLSYGIMMEYLQNRYTNWNSDEGELAAVRQVLFSELNIENSMDDYAEIVSGNKELRLFANRPAYLMKDVAKIKQLLSVIKPYMGNLKITDSTVYVELTPGSGKFIDVDETEGWYYKDINSEDDVYFDVNKRKKYIKINDVPYELLNNNIAVSLEENGDVFRVFDPETRYNINKEIDPSGGYVLCEDDMLRSVQSLRFKVKAPDDGVSYKEYKKLTDLAIRDTAPGSDEYVIFYAATHRGYNAVAKNEYPDMSDPNRKAVADYYIYSEGIYIKVDDPYQRHLVKNDVYYKVVTNVNDGGVNKLLLEDGSLMEPDGTEVFYYSSSAGEKITFGSTLYTWAHNTKYVTRDEIVMPVEYETYAKYNEQGKNFTLGGNAVYVKSGDDYIEIGNPNDLFAVDSDTGKERRIEFSNRKYVQNADGSYLYVQNAYDRYSALLENKKTTPTAVIKVDGEFITPANDSNDKFIYGAMEDDNVSGNYVVGSDGGYHSLAGVKISTDLGDINLNGAQYSYLNNDITINDWTAYDLQNVYGDDLYVKDVSGSISKSSRIEGATVTPVKDLDGDYLLGNDGNYYNKSDLLLTWYVDYDDKIHNSADGVYVLDNNVAKNLSVGEDGKIVEYCKFENTYYQISTVDSSKSILTANNKTLVAGHRYITVTENAIVQVTESNDIFVESAEDSDRKYKISGVDGLPLKVKVLANDLHSGLTGVIGIKGNQSINFGISGGFYSFEEVKIRDTDGELHSLSDLRISLDGTSELGRAVDALGNSRVYIKLDGENIAIPYPSMQYKPNENAAGTHLKLNDKYYNLTNGEIGLKIKYVNENGIASYYKLPNNIPPSVFYLNTDDIPVTTSDIYNQKIVNTTVIKQGEGGYTSIIDRREDVRVKETKAVDGEYYKYGSDDKLYEIKIASEQITDTSTTPTTVNPGESYIVIRVENEDDKYLKVTNNDKRYNVEFPAVRVGDRYYDMKTSRLHFGKATTGETGVSELTYIQYDGVPTFEGEGNDRLYDTLFVEANGKYVRFTDRDDGDGSVKYYGITNDTKGEIATAEASTFVLGSDGAYYPAKYLKVKIDGNYFSYNGIYRSIPADNTSDPVKITSSLVRYSFIQNIEGENYIGADNFVKDAKGMYHNSKVYIENDSNGEMEISTGDKISFTANGKNVPSPSNFIVPHSAKGGDFIKKGDCYYRIDELEVAVGEDKAKVKGFYVENDDKKISVNDVLTRYVINDSEDATGLIKGENNVYYSSGSLIKIKDGGSLYGRDANGKFVRAERQGYFKASEVEGDPNFTKLQDIYYKSDDGNPPTYSIAGVTAGEVYVFGTMYEFIDIGIGTDNLYYKAEGDFSRLDDDIYTRIAQAKIKGEDGALYSPNDIYVAGKQFEYRDLREMKLIAERSTGVDADKVFVKSLFDNLEDLRAITVDNPDITQVDMFSDVIDRLEDYLGSLVGDLEVYSKDVAYYNDAKIIVDDTVEKNKNFLAEGGDVLANALDKLLNRFDGLGTDDIGNMEWRERYSGEFESYVRNVRNEINNYKISSNERNVYFRRLAEARDISNYAFGDAITSDEFFGDNLAKVVKKLMNAAVGSSSPEEKLGVAYQMFSDCANKLITLTKSWSLQDSELTRGPELLSLTKRIDEIAKAMKQVSLTLFKNVETQRNVYGKVMILEYVLGNYGKVGDEIKFLADKDEFPAKTDDDKGIYIKFESVNDEIESVLHLVDRSNNEEIELFYRYDFTELKVEKCIAKNGEPSNYWVDGRRGTDASPWDGGSIYFRDALRHADFAHILGNYFQEETKPLGEKDPVTKFVQEVKWMMDVPIYQVNEKLGFFTMNGISQPAILEFSTGKTAELEMAPNSTSDPSENKPNPVIEGADNLLPKSSLAFSGTVLSIPDGQAQAPLHKLISYMMSTNLKDVPSKDEMSNISSDHLAKDAKIYIAPPYGTPDKYPKNVATDFENIIDSCRKDKMPANCPYEPMKLMTKGEAEFDSKTICDHDHEKKTDGFINDKGGGGDTPDGISRITSKDTKLNMIWKDGHDGNNVRNDLLRLKNKIYDTSNRSTTLNNAINYLAVNKEYDYEFNVYAHGWDPKYNDWRWRTKQAIKDGPGSSKEKNGHRNRESILQAFDGYKESMNNAYGNAYTKLQDIKSKYDAYDSNRMAKKAVAEAEGEKIKAVMDNLRNSTAWSNSGSTLKTSLEALSGNISGNRAEGVVSYTKGDSKKDPAINKALCNDVNFANAVNNVWYVSAVFKKLLDDASDGTKDVLETFIGYVNAFENGATEDDKVLAAENIVKVSLPMQSKMEEVVSEAKRVYIAAGSVVDSFTRIAYDSLLNLQAKIEDIIKAASQQDKFVQSKKFYEYIQTLESGYQNWRTNELERQKFLTELNRKDVKGSGFLLLSKDFDMVKLFVSNYKMIGGLLDVSGVANKEVLGSLQSSYPDWSTNTIQKNALMEEINDHNSLLPNDKTAIKTYINNYPTNDLYSIPIRLGVSTAGDVMADFKEIPAYNNSLCAFTRVDEPKEFEVPLRGAVGSFEWKTIESIVDTIGATGSDTMLEYMHRQFDLLMEKGIDSGQVDNRALINIGNVLRELEERIRTYAARGSNGSDNAGSDKMIANGLINWYNAITDCVAGHIKKSLQLSINGENGLAAKWDYPEGWTQDGLLRYMTMDNKNCAISLVMADSLVNTNAYKMLQLKENYKEAININLSYINNIKSYQTSLLNMIDQYTAMTESNKQNYDSTVIRYYIASLKKEIEKFIKFSSSTGSDGREVISFSIGDNFPAETKDMYVNYVNQLDAIERVLTYKMQMDQTELFYEWFVKVENIYADWRINGKNRERLLKQLEFFANTKVAFTLPLAVANSNLDADPKDILLKDGANVNKLSEKFAEINSLIGAAYDTIESIFWSNTVNINDNTISRFTDIKNKLKGSDNGTAKHFFDEAKRFNEFRSIDDQNACEAMIEEMYKTVSSTVLLLQMVKDKGISSQNEDDIKNLCMMLNISYTGVVDAKSKINSAMNGFNDDNEVLALLRNAISAQKSSCTGGTLQKMLSTGTNYFSGTLIEHIIGNKTDENTGLSITGYIKQYNTKTDFSNVDAKDKVKSLVAIHGITGDLNFDQVAVINLIENMRVAVYNQYNDEVRKRPVLLASQISGESANIEAKSLKDSPDLVESYYETMKEFERNSSMVVLNFLKTNVNHLVSSANQIGTNTDETGKINAFNTVLNAILGNGVYNSLEDGRPIKTLSDIFSYSGSDATLKAVIDVLNVLSGKSADNLLRLDVEKKDSFLDVLNKYKSLFVLEGSIMAHIEKYMVENAAWRFFMGEIDSVFSRYENWRTDSSQKTSLRSELSQLKNMIYYHNLNNDQWEPLALQPLSNANYEMDSNGNFITRMSNNIRVEGEPSGGVMPVIDTPTEESTQTSENALTVEDMPKGIQMSEHIENLLSQVRDYNANNDPKAVYVTRKAEIDNLVKSTFGNAMDSNVLINTNKVNLIIGNGIITEENIFLVIKKLEDLVSVWNIRDTNINKEAFKLVNAGRKEGEPEKRIVTDTVLALIDDLKTCYSKGEAYAFCSIFNDRLSMAEYIYSVMNGQVSNLEWHNKIVQGADESLMLQATGVYTFKDSEGHTYACSMYNGETKIMELPAMKDDEINGYVNGLRKTTFYEAENLQGVFFKENSNGDLTDVKLSITADGKTYISTNGGLIDANGNSLSFDEEGFFINKNDERIVIRGQSTGSSDVAYKVDATSGKILGVEYDIKSESYKVGSYNVVETYNTRFIYRSGKYEPSSQYLTKENVRQGFLSEIMTIGSELEQRLNIWKAGLSGIGPEYTSTALASVSEFTAMFSRISDRLATHDVKMYNESMEFHDEQYMISGINSSLRNLSGDGDLQNFVGLSERARKLYDAANKLTKASANGMTNEIKALTSAYNVAQTEYENSKKNASAGYGNYELYVISLKNLFKEAENDLKYNISVQFEKRRKGELIAAYVFSNEKYKAANEVLSLVKSVDRVTSELNGYLASMAPRKDFQALLDVIENGNSKYSQEPILPLAKARIIEKSSRLRVYQGWHGDSMDATMYRSALDSVRNATYFANSEEVRLISTESLDNYLGGMDSSLEKYIEEMKDYELYDGLLNDVYGLEVFKDGRIREISGVGINVIISDNIDWMFSQASKDLFLSELISYSKTLDVIIKSYDKGGQLYGKMKSRVLDKIKALRKYIGTEGSNTKSDYIGSVALFKAYDSDNYSRLQQMYKKQATMIKRLKEDYRVNKISIDEFITKIEELPMEGGPLDEYITSLKEFLYYTKALEEYQLSLLQLQPKYYVYDKTQSKWLTVDESGMTEKQIKSSGGKFIRLVKGYDGSGNPIYIEDYSLTDSITKPVFVSASAMWHGEYSSYGVVLQLLATLYEKFTTQKQLLADIIKQVEENNEKINEANRILQDINKVQASAAKAGEDAKVAIPANVIMYFGKNKIKAPTTMFANDAEMEKYENSTFNKRMNYLSSMGTDASMLISYITQGQLKPETGMSLMLGDLSSTDLLELGSMKEIYDKVSGINGKFGDVANSVKSKNTWRNAAIFSAFSLPLAAFGGLILGAGAAFGIGYAASSITTKGSNTQLSGAKYLSGGSDNKLLEVYWNTRLALEGGSTLPKSVMDNYVQGLFNSMDEDIRGYAFPSDDITPNRKKTDSASGDINGFQLVNWAPITNDWGGTGHYYYAAKDAARAGGFSEDEYDNNESAAKMIEAMELISHQKFYKNGSVYKENFTEPDYDYNAMIMAYKIEAMIDMFGVEAAGIAVKYLTGSQNRAKTVSDLDALADKSRSSDKNNRVYTKDEITKLKAYIDGEKLFTSDDISPPEQRMPLTHFWTHSDVTTRDDGIKSILNRCYGSGKSGLGADEVSLWSESLRIHIDKLNADGQMIATNMQRTMQICNETTAIATQILKNNGDTLRQIYANIR